VSHGHILVNGKRVTIPSYLVRENDTVSVHERAKRMTVIKDGLKEYSRAGVVPWLEVDPDALTGLVRGIPQRGDVADLAGVNEQLIVELYSK
jgi:small subunit ribosomal protein S4